MHLLLGFLKSLIKSPTHVLARVQLFQQRSHPTLVNGVIKLYSMFKMHALVGDVIKLLELKVRLISSRHYVCRHDAVSQ